MKFQGKTLIVYYGQGRSSASDGVDIVVSVKISKKAVVRNRIRRQIREIIRHYRKQGSFLARGFRVVVLPQILAAEFREIKQDLESVLKKIK